MASEKLEWDIVTRLREGRTNGSHLRWSVRQEHTEAADEIERLRHAFTAMLDRYEEYCGGADLPHAGVHDIMLVEFARTTLGK